MFGNKKMYKKGLADAMQAYEGFSEKQKVALEQLRQEVENGTKQLEEALDGLGDDINGIYQYLNAKEKAALYHLSTPLDIKKLELEEQQLLIAILYQLAENEGKCLTDAQRAYIRSVQRYLGITNPQTSVDLAVVGDIDSLDAQKAILQVVLEFFYLQNTEELMDHQEDFLGNFSVNKKQALAIENCVSRLYNAVGAQGIAEKYGSQADEQNSPAEIEKRLDSFESWLKDLAYCGSFKVAHIHLDNYSNASVIASIDSVSFKDRDRCRQAAERRVDKEYRTAEKGMNELMASARSSSFYYAFKEYFGNRLESLRKHLRELRNVNSAEITDKMEGYMVASNIYNKAKQISDKLLSRYSLPSVSSYYSEIEYDTYDPSEYEENFAAKLFAKGFKRYGFSCIDALTSIAHDTDEILGNFKEDFNSQIQDEILSSIVEPIQDLLPQLRDALNGTD